MSVPPTPEQSDTVVRVEHLSKSFRRRDGSTVPAIDDISFAVAQGDFVVLLGPSGCGKTTLLRSIAGLETPNGGDIKLNGRAQFSAANGTNVPPERRGISMVFQSYALWPHMTAFRNVAYPLESRRSTKRDKAGIARKVRRTLELVGIPELERQHAGQISGGQQQRVALARALVSNDSLVLFDEPLSNVDAKVREQLRVELLSLQRELGFAAIFVTHDQTEAMQLGSRVAVLDSGRLMQVDTPMEIYTKPANRYVAKFVGTTNEHLGAVTALKGETVVVETNAGTLTGRAGTESVRTGDQVAALWRPEAATVSNEAPVAANRLRGTLKASLFVGPHTEHIVDTGGREVRVQVPGAGTWEAGADVWVEIPENDMLVLPAEDT